MSSGLSISIPSLTTLVQRLDESPAFVTNVLQKTIYKSLILIQRNARQEAPRALSGTNESLAGNIMITLQGLTGIVHPNVPYARYVEEGTKPHHVPLAAITPWAEFKGLNPYAVAAGIALHGTKANPFMERAAVSSTPEVLAFFDEALEEVSNILN